MDGGIVLKLHIRMELYSEGCDQLSACWKCMSFDCILHFLNALRLLYCIGALSRSMCESSIVGCLLCLRMVGEVIIEDCWVSLLNFSHLWPQQWIMQLIWISLDGHRKFYCGKSIVSLDHCRSDNWPLVGFFVRFLTPLAITMDYATNPDYFWRSTVQVLIGFFC